MLGEFHRGLDLALGIHPGYRLLGEVDVAKAKACLHRFAAIADVLAPDFDGFYAEHRALSHRRKIEMDSLESVAPSSVHDAICETLLQVAGSRATYTAQRCEKCGLTYGRRKL